MFCSNNYLGLANHPDVVEAGIEGLFVSMVLELLLSVLSAARLLHMKHSKNESLLFLVLKQVIHSFLVGMQLRQRFPTLCQDGDVIVSDELNHACIIDSMRLATAIHRGVSKCIYKHSNMGSLREALVTATQKQSG